MKATYTISFGWGPLLYIVYGEGGSRSSKKRGSIVFGVDRDGKVCYNFRK
jgi:hypothetical protein